MPTMYINILRVSRHYDDGQIYAETMNGNQCLKAGNIKFVANTQAFFNEHRISLVMISPSLSESEQNYLKLMAAQWEAEYKMMGGDTNTK